MLTLLGDSPPPPTFSSVTFYLYMTFNNRLWNSFLVLLCVNLRVERLENLKRDLKMYKMFWWYIGINVKTVNERMMTVAFDSTF